jgi:hypothetical protein
MLPSRPECGRPACQSRLALAPHPRAPRVRAVEGSGADAAIRRGNGRSAPEVWMRCISMPAKLSAAFSAAFLLASGHLNHTIVMSLEVFTALHAGAAFGYLHWLGLLGWAAPGNIIGGIGFVTVLRLVQVGAGTIKQQRAAGAARD